MHQQQETLLARQPRDHNAEQTQELVQKRQVQSRLRIHRRALPSATGSETAASWGLEKKPAMGIERGGFSRADDDLGGGLFVRDVDQSRTWIAGSYQYSISGRRVPRFAGRLTIFQLDRGISANQHPTATFVRLFSATAALPEAAEDGTEGGRGSDAEGLWERVQEPHILLYQGRDGWAESRLVGHGWRGEVELAGGEDHERSIR